MLTAISYNQFQQFKFQIQNLHMYLDNAPCYSPYK